MGAGFSPDAPITITQILDSNGLDDALWCLRAVGGYDREIRLFGVKQARKVQHLNADPRVEACLKAAEDFSSGLISLEQLSAARSAGSAAWSAAWSEAGAAARAAAEAAAWAAKPAARSAARAAALADQAKDLRQLCKDCE
jgi:hypothetical protein